MSKIIVATDQFLTARGTRKHLFARRPGAAMLAGISLVFAGCGGGGSATSPTTPLEPTNPPPPIAFSTSEALGQSLFSDVNLSLNRTQSCATCHDPAQAFTDNRLNAAGVTAAFSLGDDGISMGNRNAPTATYASFAPDFRFGTHPRLNSQQPDYIGFEGGQFLDGRAANLQDHAKAPPIGPGEMGMPDIPGVIERIRENPGYDASFRALFGDDIFDDPNEAYDAMANSIAAFEKTEEFSTFDSQYDRSLTGDFVFDPASKAAQGKALFFSQQFSNCATCHQLQPNSSRTETFTSYEYHNIGIPINQNARLASNQPLDTLDEGLFNNPEVDDPAERGKFKVPTLRNVAVTGPYMHNGVFRSLDTVIKFYGKFLTTSDFPVNPETGSPWRKPPIPDTVSFAELEDGRKLNQDEVDALVCFLRTLTDRRYEPLIEEDGVICS